jgi:hypothetical protein
VLSTLLVLALGGVPRSCLPAELGQPAPVSAPQPPLPPPPPPPPAPPLAPIASPLTRDEHAQYRISFGILGKLGQLDISVVPGEVARLQGRAHGSLLGIGETLKGLDTELDPRALVGRRWTDFRRSGGKTVTDIAQQGTYGTVAILRRRTDKPERSDVLRRGGAVLDPLTFLMQVRVKPPAAPHTYEVLDGQALWQIDLRPARLVPDGQRRALRVEGLARPVLWDGRVDDDRSNHAFSLWLSDDAFHTPLRVVMPLAVGEVRAELVALTRTEASRAAPRLLTRGPLLRWLASPTPRR